MPGDDYLVALARAADAECIVCGDPRRRRDRTGMLPAYMPPSILLRWPRGPLSMLVSPRRAAR
jgi:hypothetical protein